MVLFELETTEMTNSLGAGIVITGGGAKLKNLSQLAAYVTGCDIRIGNPKISVGHIDSKFGISIYQMREAISSASSNLKTTRINEQEDKTNFLRNLTQNYNTLKETIRDWEYKYVFYVFITVFKQQINKHRKCH